MSCVKAEKILILSELPASVCSLNDNKDMDHIFALKSDSWKTSVNCQFLPSPNIVSNLPAAGIVIILILILTTSHSDHYFLFLVLSHCQVFNIPAVMYIAVTATDSVVDSAIIKIFNSLLDCEPLKDIPKVCQLIFFTTNLLCFHIKRRIFHWVEHNNSMFMILLILGNELT